MTVKKIGFPSILPDNDMNYLARVFMAISTVDNDSEVTVFKNIASYSFSIIPGRESNFKKIVNAMIDLHKPLLMNIEFSRSLKYSNIISFKLN